MFNIIVLLKVQNEKDIDFIADCLERCSEITLQEEPGCRKFEVYHSEADSRLFILCEEWERKEDWEEHRQKRAFQEIYLPRVLPLVEREPHISRRVAGR
jgi:quinol monooxygenase YgiN